MATATFTWVDPTERVDGTALAASEIASIEIFDMAVAVPIGTVPPGLQTFTTGVLASGTYNFTAACKDTLGHTSAMTPTVTLVVPVVITSPPKPPSNFAGTLNL